jgi:L-iditol 2-dehydrogenase
MQGKTVVVFGAGPVGLLCVAVARAFGASTVLVVDVVPSRLSSALKYGATHTYQMTPESPEHNAEDILNAVELEIGADVVLDATGAEPCMNCGIHVLASGGTFVQVGLGKPNPSLPVGQICDKEIVFKGSFRYGPGDYRTAIEAEDAFKNVVSRAGIKSVIYGPGVDEHVAKATLT